MENENQPEIQNSSFKVDVHAVLNQHKKDKSPLEEDDYRIKFNLKENELRAALEGKKEIFFIIEMKNFTDGFLYKGFLNEDFERNYFGKNSLQSGDFFLGSWNKNKMQSGVYLHGQAENQATEAFIGERDENGLRTKGVYIWKKDDSSLEAFVGDFINNNVSEGLLFSESGQIITIYIGKFKESEGKIIRSDDNAFYYNSERQVFYEGEIQGDSLVDGTFITLGQESSKCLKLKINPEQESYTEKVPNEESDLFKRKFEQFNSVNWKEPILKLYEEGKAEVEKFNTLDDFSNLEENEEDVKRISSLHFEICNKVKEMKK